MIVVRTHEGTELLQDGCSMSPLATRILRLTVYAIIPVALATIFILMYLSGNPVLQSLVMPPSPRDWMRILLIRNLQTLFAVFAMLTVHAGALVMNRRPERLLSVLVFLVLWFVWFNWDFGLVSIHNQPGAGSLHQRCASAVVFVVCILVPLAACVFVHDPPRWLNWLVSAPLFAGTCFLIFSRQAEMNGPFKSYANAVVLGLFILVPIAAKRIKSPLLTRFAPDMYSIFTVVEVVGLGCLAHALGSSGVAADGGAPIAVGSAWDWGCLIEIVRLIQELVLFYLLFVYAVDVVFVGRLREVMREERSVPPPSELDMQDLEFP